MHSHNFANNPLNSRLTGRIQLWKRYREIKIVAFVVTVVVVVSLLDFNALYFAEFQLQSFFHWVQNSDPSAKSNCAQRSRQ